MYEGPEQRGLRIYLSEKPLMICRRWAEIRLSLLSSSGCRTVDIVYI